VWVLLVFRFLLPPQSCQLLVESHVHGFVKSILVRLKPRKFFVDLPFDATELLGSFPLHHLEGAVQLQAVPSELGLGGIGRNRKLAPEVCVQCLQSLPQFVRVLLVFRFLLPPESCELLAESHVHGFV